MSTMSEAQFDARFTVVDGDEGSYHTKVPEGVPVERAWTAVDGDDGGIYLLPGYHVVNHVAYVITNEPWTDELVEVEWMPPSGYEEDGAPQERCEVTDPFQHAEPDTRGEHDPML